MAVYVTQCKACSSPLRLDINKRLASGQGAKSIAEWLVSLGAEHAISRNALMNHKSKHMTTEVAQSVHELEKQQQTIDVSPTDFAELVRARAADRLLRGVIAPDIKDGLAAQALIERRTERVLDRAFIFQLAQLLGGGAAGSLGDGVVEGTFVVLDDERRADERDFRQLGAGEGSVPRDGVAALDAG